MQIKTTLKYHYTPIRMVKIKNIMPSYGKGVENLEFSCSRCVCTGTTTLESCELISTKAKHVVTPRPSNSTPGYIPKRKVHMSIIHFI